MRDLSTEDIARLFSVSIRTAKNYVRQWAAQQERADTPRVIRAPGASRRWQYWVDAASLKARFPLIELE